MLESNFDESSKSDTYREWMTQYMSPIKCSVCNERRLRPESLAVKIAGRSISEYVALSIAEARPAVDTILKTLGNLAPTGNRRPRAGKKSASVWIF